MARTIADISRMHRKPYTILYLQRSQRTLKPEVTDISSADIKLDTGSYYNYCRVYAAAGNLLIITLNYNY